MKPLLKSSLFIFCAIYSVWIAKTAFADDTGGKIEVLISGGKLEKMLDISNRIVIPLGALMRGGLTVQNMSKNLIHIEYKSEWYDEYAMVASSGVWHRLTLHPNLGKSITAVSKSVQGKNLVVNIRLPDDGVLKGKYFKQSLSGPDADSTTNNTK